MTATAQERAAAPRRASGIAIDPGQLTRMRDAVPLSRAELAARTGQLLFDYGLFYRVLAGTVRPEVRMVRVLWLALDCSPQDIVPLIPPGLSPAEAGKWLKANDGWSLDLGAVARLREEHPVVDADGVVTGCWQLEDLAAAAGRNWFSRDEVNKIEQAGDSGTGRRPKGDTLRAFCQILSCKPADLMPGSDPLPDGQTAARRAQLDFNAGMRAYADERGISYRRGDRIVYSPGLREEYAEYLAGQDTETDGEG